MSEGAARARTGRPQATTHRDIEVAALELFAARGFEHVSVADIATAAGISRRTFFRYYGSKNDVVWGDFDRLLAAMERGLERSGDGPLLAAITDVVIRFNTFPDEAVPAHRLRMSLILHTPALQAHSALRYADWRAVIARHAARRLGQPVDALVPQLVGHVALAAAVTAHEQWLADPSAILSPLIRESFDRLSIELGGPSTSR
ncbi:MAG TPA: mycofactocin system transcriptional regulator [Acidimicrobiales bacterium]|nr:mycofactocin system transcriptional regulator [Acidimicrobiales bacterium]